MALEKKNFVEHREKLLISFVELGSIAGPSSRKISVSLGILFCHN